MKTLKEENRKNTVLESVNENYLDETENQGTPRQAKPLQMKENKSRQQSTTSTLKNARLAVNFVENYKGNLKDLISQPPTL